MHFRLNSRAPVAGRQGQSSHFSPEDLGALAGRRRRRASFRYAAASGLWGLGGLGAVPAGRADPEACQRLVDMKTVYETFAAADVCNPAIMAANPSACKQQKSAYDMWQALKAERACRPAGTPPPPTRTPSPPPPGALTDRDLDLLFLLAATGEQQKKGMSPGAVAGIALAGVVGLGLLYLVIRS